MSANLLSSIVLYDLGFEMSMKPGHGVNILRDGKVIANTVRAGESIFQLKTPKLQAKAARTVRAESLEVWHKRLGHLGKKNVLKLETMADGIKITKDSTLGVCEDYQIGKQTLTPSHEPRTQVDEPLGLIHADTSGKIEPPTKEGYNYYGLFINDATGMTAIVPMKTSSSKEMLSLFKEYKERMENELGQRIKRFRSDGGGEYEKGFEAYLKQCGIKKEIAAPYSADQNGVSERANRTIVERAKAIMAGMDIPKYLWFEVAKSVVHLKNRSPTKFVPTTPYEAWYNQQPNLSYLRIISTTCYVHIPKEKRVKLDDIAHSAIFLGYAGTNQYRV
jgi:GAG-pre-integrase domain